MDRLEQSAVKDPKKLAKLGGLVLDLDDERDHARALLERALALEEPATAGFALYHLGRLELAAGNPNEALARFLQVQAETMMGWLGRFGASHVHLARDKAGSLARVEEELARMRDTYPAFDRGPDFLLFRAEVALAGERLDEARELVARVLAERPPDYDFGVLIRARRLRDRVVI
jgi:tetratricopeptide (TPR) repeat protein